MKTKISKKQEKQSFIDQYLKENLYDYVSSPKAKVINHYIKRAKQEYNKKILEQTPERYYDVTFRTPFGAVSTYRLKGKSGYDAFRKYNYIDIQGNRMKFISATLSKNQN